MKRLAALAVALLATAAAGCGTRQETITPRSSLALRVALLAPNAGEAPIYAAARNGHFREAGLAVTTSESSSPLQSLGRLAGGGVDLAVSTEPAVLEARDRGLRVVSIAALVQRPLSAAIWLRGGPVGSRRDLASNTVGTPGLDYERAFARQLDARAGALRDVGANAVGALEHRRVAAVVGAYSNQDGVALELAGRGPVVTPVDAAGVPTFDELVIAAPEGISAHGRDAARSFVGALVRGTRDLLHGSPSATAAFAAAERGVDRRLPPLALSRTLPLLTPPSPQPYGYQDPNLWRAFATWMRANGLLSRPQKASGALTNTLLPGAGL